MKGAYLREALFTPIMTALQDIFDQLLREFPSFRPRWEEHLAFWKGEPAGSYNDMAEFVHFVVDDLYPSGDSASVQRAFDLMERWLTDESKERSDVVALGFLETLQNFASWRAFGSKVFVQFLGPKSRQVWNELEATWAGKSSLMDVIRAERECDNE